MWEEAGVEGKRERERERERAKSTKQDMSLHVARLLRREELMVFLFSPFPLCSNKSREGCETRGNCCLVIRLTDLVREMPKSALSPLLSYSIVPT